MASSDLKPNVPGSKAWYAALARDQIRKNELPISGTVWQRRLLRLRPDNDRCCVCEPLHYPAKGSGLPVPVHWTSRRCADNLHCCLCACKYCLCPRCREQMWKNDQPFQPPLATVYECSMSMSNCRSCEYRSLGQEDMMHEMQGLTREQYVDDQWRRAELLERLISQPLVQPLVRAALQLDDLADIVLQQLGGDVLLPDNVLAKIIPMVRLQEEVTAYLALSPEKRKEQATTHK